MLRLRWTAELGAAGRRDRHEDYIRLSDMPPTVAVPACGDEGRALACRAASETHSVVIQTSAKARMEDKTARFTILIDADKKKAFDQLCAEQDVTASQMIRHLIKDYLDRHGVDYGEGAMRTKKARKRHGAG